MSVPSVRVTHGGKSRQCQILEKRKGADKVNVEGDKIQAEGFDEGREPVEWDKGVTRKRYPKVYDIAKGANPTTRTRIRSGDIHGAMNGESARVASGRVGRIGEGLLPPFNRRVLGVEFDASEEVFSRRRNP